MEINNRKAYHDYFVEDTLECGISLRGNEVKSVRSGSCSIKESWCYIKDGQLVLCQMHIARWGTANAFDVDENRERVLLAHKREIRKLYAEVQKSGVTLIPLKVYFKDGKCKVLLGVCVGKKSYDKRSALKEKQAKRDIERAVKNENCA